MAKKKMAKKAGRGPRAGINSAAGIKKGAIGPFIPRGAKKAGGGAAAGISAALGRLTASAGGRGPSFGSKGRKG